MGDESDPQCRAQQLFDGFVSAASCRAALWSFSQLTDLLQLDRDEPPYRPIRRRLNYWRADALGAKLERRAARPEYQEPRACRNTTCVVVGAGPCGLRTAVELRFLGARVVLLEKRDCFSRNNVLHLWPFTIHDLRALGAKKFYGRFCAGAIDHISIRQLQLILLKVALLLGVEVHVNVEFKHLKEPPEDQRPPKVGWRMEVSPKSHTLNQLEFDVVIGADGRRNTLPGFRRKDFRGKLAIAITANFRNRNTTAEAKVEEISGVAFIFNQRFFMDLQQETGIDLENIVYYRDDTHYFVMTAKKQSLLGKGVIKQDFADTGLLLSRSNVDQHALQAFAREAADFSTNQQLPSLEFSLNHNNQPDVAMFDFTSMSAAEHAAMIRQSHGHQLLVSLVGDSLLEPFWPMGTGIARGFLAALDSAWMICRRAQGAAPLEVLAERESLYRLLPQSTPENLQRNFSRFTIDPQTRYLNPKLRAITPEQVRHLLDTGEEAGLHPNSDDIIVRKGSFCPTNQLLSWCQEQTRGYRGVAISDLTTSWRSGLALCALIHKHRPDIIDFESLDVSSEEGNLRLALELSRRFFRIVPVMTEEELLGGPDSLSMVMFLSQFYQRLHTAPPAGENLPSLLSRLSPSSKRNLKEQKGPLGKRRSSSAEGRDLQVDFGDESQVGGAKVRQLANRLQAKLDKNSTSCWSPASSSSDSRLQQQEEEEEEEELSPSADGPTDTAPPKASWKPRKRTPQQEQMSFRFREKIKSQEQVCVFCGGRVYLMQLQTAEGLFFHRSCFLCFSCSGTLRGGGHNYDPQLRRFYCLHCDPRVRTRPPPHRVSIVSLGPPLSGRRRSSAVSVRVREERSEEEDPPHWTREEEEELSEEEDEDEEDLMHYLNFSLEDEMHKASSESGMGESSSGTSEYKTSWSETLKEHFREEEEEEEEEGSEQESSDAEGSDLTAQPETPPQAHGSAPDEDLFPATHAIVIETALRGRSSFDAITPELPPYKSVGSGTEGAGITEAPPPRQVRGGGASTLWRTFFPADRVQEKTSANHRTATSDDVIDKHLSKLTSDLQRVSVKENQENQEENHDPLYVPHALAFKRAYAIKRHSLRAAFPPRRTTSCPPLVSGGLFLPQEPSVLSIKEALFLKGGREEAKEVRRRVKGGGRRRREELQRLHQAQMIQRQLQQVEEKQRHLEERGVRLERVLRGEADYWGDSSDSEDMELHLAGLGKLDRPALMQQWFLLVQQKNCLLRYESELMILAREVELEDRQSRLQQELRDRMAVEDHLKPEVQLLEEVLVLQEMLEVVQQRDSLVALLEEHRLHGRQEDQDLEGVLSQGLGLTWP
ncbi:hypothetical protein PBY51_009147 [Eleginops maclovinus]|uniref:F-actin monooxygenase n=1 Tax=Eleginops maclovinus TaxID=56733 RepID=A0AAN7WIS5_ELEMC|nr:hypothetical protein PBY51_009147 [Eleginops maclovinus]